VGLALLAMQAEIGDDGSGRTRIKRTTVGSRDSKEGMQAPMMANKGSVASFKDEDDIDTVVAMMKSRMSMNKDTSSKLRGLPGYSIARPIHPTRCIPCNFPCIFGRPVRRVWRTSWCAILRFSADALLPVIDTNIRWEDSGEDEKEVGGKGEGETLAEEMGRMNVGGGTDKVRCLHHMPYFSAERCMASTICPGDPGSVLTT
jgi:hypothetical protein